MKAPRIGLSLPDGLRLVKDGIRRRRIAVVPAVLFESGNVISPVPNRRRAGSACVFPLGLCWQFVLPTKLRQPFAVSRCVRATHIEHRMVICRIEPCVTPVKSRMLRIVSGLVSNPSPSTNTILLGFCRKICLFNELSKLPFCYLESTQPKRLGDRHRLPRKVVEGAVRRQFSQSGQLLAA